MCKVFINVINIIIITRPRPAFGRLGLGGSLGWYTYHGYTSHASPRACGARLGQKKARIVGNMQEFQRSNLPTFFLPFQPSNLLARRRFTAEEIAREFELTIITFDYKGLTFKQISSAVNLQCSSGCCWCVGTCLLQFGHYI